MMHSVDPMFSACCVFYNILDGPEGKPTMKVNPEEGEQYEGKEVIFECASFIHGNPRTYTYTWKKDGSILNNVEDDTKNTLTFKMTPADAGNYSCIAGNDYGDSEESVAVQLLFNPGIPPPDGTSSIKNLKQY